MRPTALDRSSEKTPLFATAARNSSGTTGLLGAQVLLGNNPRMRQAFDLIRSFAGLDMPVWITGESGSGKKLAAHVLHQLSARADRPLVVVNCRQAGPGTLYRELFGNDASDGEVPSSGGALAQADGGSLLLEQVQNLPSDAQARLLRFLNASAPIGADGGPARPRVRILSTATAARQPSPMLPGGLREDLFHHLNGLVVRIPSLRERREDLDMVARDVLRRAANEARREVEGFEPATLAIMRAYPWPDNLRELVAVVRRAVMAAHGPMVAPADLGLHANWGTEADCARRVPGSPHEGAAVREVLERADGNITRAAQLLGVSRVTFYRMLRRNGLTVRRAVDAAVRAAGTPEQVQFATD